MKRDTVENETPSMYQIIELSSRMGLDEFQIIEAQLLKDLALLLSIDLEEIKVVELQDLNRKK